VLERMARPGTRMRRVCLYTPAHDEQTARERIRRLYLWDLVKMRQASAQVIASQKMLENKYKQAQATSDDWYRRAQLALVGPGGYCSPSHPTHFQPSPFEQQDIL
jgi:hypothetical protein